MTQTKFPNQRLARVANLTALLWMGIGICLLPPVFELLFSISDLLDHEAELLWIFAAGLLLVATSFWLKRMQLPGWLVALGFGGLLIPAGELGFRVAANAGMHQYTKDQLTCSARHVSGVFRLYRPSIYRLHQAAPTGRFPGNVSVQQPRFQWSGYGVR